MATKVKRCCASCLKAFPKLLACQRCCSAFYCSAACQKTQWPFHRKDCSAVDPLRKTNRCIFNQIRSILDGDDPDIKVNDEAVYFLNWFHCAIERLRLELTYRGSKLDTAVKKKQLVRLIEKAIVEARNSIIRRGGPLATRSKDDGKSMFAWRWRILPVAPPDSTDHILSAEARADCSLSLTCISPGSRGYMVHKRPRFVADVPPHHFLDHYGAVRKKGWIPTPPLSVAAASYLFPITKKQLYQHPSEERKL